MRTHSLKVFGLLAASTACMAAGPFGCPLPGELVGDITSSQDYFHTFSRSTSASYSAWHYVDFDLVSPTHDFIVEIEATPVGDESVVCAQQSDLCDVSVEAYLEISCTGVVRQRLDIPLTQAGLNARGSVSGLELSRALCVGSTSGQRTPVTWRVNIERNSPDAVRFHVTVTWVDYNNLGL